MQLPVDESVLDQVGGWVEVTQGNGCNVKQHNMHRFSQQPLLLAKALILANFQLLQQHSMLLFGHQIAANLRLNFETINVDF